MDLYKGARLWEVVLAAYEQGLRNGRSDVFAALDKLKEQPELKHRSPGRPRKKTTAKKTTAKKTTAKKTTAKKTAAKKTAAK
jgi:topoisomerase IA-like protein